MELKPLSGDLDELRKIIISSNLATCYLILDQMGLKEGKTIYYDEFNSEWIETYKTVYKIVSKMKIRKSSRE